ncbi:MAG TPA: hypothetical protein VL358_07370 [Caulobacteraceae bacterium]|nr:hypothetical protein [Caulobacteraceae bacterium]
MAINRAIEELGKGPLTEGDGRGLGNTLGPDVGAEDRLSGSDAARVRKREVGDASGATAESAANRRPAGSRPPGREKR